MSHMEIVQTKEIKSEKKQGLIAIAILIYQICNDVNHPFNFCTSKPVKSSEFQ